MLVGKLCPDEDHPLWKDSEADSPGEIKKKTIPKTSGKVQLGFFLKEI